MPEGPILEIRDLNCSLGGRRVLRGINLSVKRGETVILLGRSGSGKTTLLRTINGLVPIDSGEISFEGRSLSSWNLIELRRHTGYVIQDAGLFPHWTVGRNVALGPELAGWPPERIRPRIEEVLRLTGLDPAEFLDRYPRHLSGGQKQRAGIARALAADPPLLLLDEPFGALDPITRHDLQRHFLELRRSLGKTALFVTHDVREALMMGTRIALLRDGVLEVVEPPDQFRRSDSAEAKAFLSSLEELQETQ